MQLREESESHTDASHDVSPTLDLALPDTDPRSAPETAKKSPAAVGELSPPDSTGSSYESIVLLLDAFIALLRTMVRLPFAPGDTWQEMVVCDSQIVLWHADTPVRTRTVMLSLPR